MTHSGEKYHFPGPVSVNNTVLTVETQCITILTLLWDAVDKLQDTKYILKMLFIGNILTMTMTMTMKMTLRMIRQWPGVVMSRVSVSLCGDTWPCTLVHKGICDGAGTKYKMRNDVDCGSNYQLYLIKIGLSLGKGAIISMRSHNNNNNSSYVQCMMSFPPVRPNKQSWADILTLSHLSRGNLKIRWCTLQNTA